MSGPKCGQYQVDSVQEVERRRLAAAKERFERTVVALDLLSAEVAGAIATYGPLPIGLPSGNRPRATEPEEWERAADDLSTEIEAARRRVEEAAGTARTQLFATDATFIAISLVDEPQQSRPSLSTASDQEAVTRVLSRLPMNADPESIRKCDTLATSWHQEARQAAKDQILSTMRLVVQRERDRARLIESNRHKVDLLHQQVDGLHGREVEGIRELLGRLDLSESLPSDIDYRVQEARELAEQKKTDHSSLQRPLMLSPNSATP